jgi:hypothetical protein
MILYPKDPKKSNKKLADHVTTFSKVIGYNISLQKSVVFLYTSGVNLTKIYCKHFCKCHNVAQCNNIIIKWK